MVSHSGCQLFPVYYLNNKKVVPNVSRGVLDCYNGSIYLLDLTLSRITSLCNPVLYGIHSDPGHAPAVPRCPHNGHTSHATPSGQLKAAIRRRPLPMPLRFRDPASPYSRRDGSQGGRQEIARTPHTNHRTWQSPTVIWQHGEWLQSAKFRWEFASQTPPMNLFAEESALCVVDMDLCCLIDSEERLAATDLVTMLGDLLERGQ